MKLRVISDIHVEFYSSSDYVKSKLDKLFWDGKVPKSCIEDEILIIAGDLGVAGTGLSKDSLNHDYKSILQYFSERWKHIILIPGNHEYYDRDKDVSLNAVDAMIEKECDKLGITFLNKNYVMVPESLVKDSNPESLTKNGIAVLGCTLWSEATKEAYKGMNDSLKAILSHTELLKTHNEHKTWLKNTLKRLHKKGIKTIVVTHHLPLMELTHPKYLRNEYKHLNSAYASKLNDIFEESLSKDFKELCSMDPSESKELCSMDPSESKELCSMDPSESKELCSMDPSESMISFYCCGHTHEKTETKLYGIDFLINPLGYPREKRITKFRSQCIEI